MGFTGLDYLVLALYLVATAVFGTLLGRGQKDTTDYFLGGGKMSWWSISLSIVATETSTLTFIGAPAIAFSGNLTFLQVTFGYLIGKLLVTLILIPGYFRGQIQTAYELLNHRFGGRVRNLSAFIFLITRSLADGVRLYATALVLSVVTGLADVWTVLIIGGVTLVYTFFGGITAVVWNDVVQLIVYLAGASLAFFMILDRIPGGWADVQAIGFETGKFDLIDLDWNLTEPYTLIAGLLGGAFLTFATHGSDQLMVQRYLACGDKRKSQVALLVSGIVVIIQFLLFLLIGLMLFAYYEHFPLGHDLEQVDRIFPIFIVNEMPPGISGLVVAAIFAAAMSTLSGSLNSLASSSVNDFYRSQIRTQASEKHYFKASQWMTVGWGFLLVLVSLLSRNWGELLEVGLTITSFTMGAVLGIFLLGILDHQIDENAGLFGMVVGLATMLAVIQLTPVAWTWYVFTGATATVTAGVAYSRIQRRRASVD